VTRLPPTWTPDRRLVIELVNLSIGAQRTIVKQDNWSGGQSGPTVSADGRTIVYWRV
jgi:hypothetical protein